MDWYTPDPNVKVSEKSRNAVWTKVVNELFISFVKRAAQFSEVVQSLTVKEE